MNRYMVSAIAIIVTSVIVILTDDDLYLGLSLWLAGMALIFVSAWSDVRSMRRHRK